MIRDEWRDEDVCLRHGVSLWWRRMLNASKRERKARSVGLSGPGLECGCRRSVLEADAETLRRAICEFCDEAVLTLDIERRRWSAGEPHRMLDAIRLTTTDDLLGVTRMRELRNADSAT